MRPICKLIGLSFVSLVAATVPSNASQVIYMSIPDLNVNFVSTWCSACQTFSNTHTWELVDFFSLSDSYSVDGVAFDTASYASDSSFAGLDGVTVTIWNANAPNAIIFSQSVDPIFQNVHNFGDVYSSYLLFTSLNGPTLAPGQYGISFFAPNLLVPTFGFALSEDAIVLTDNECGRSCPVVATFGRAGYWLLGEPSSAAVPLPASLPLFASGLGLMGWLARRKKRKAAAEA